MKKFLLALACVAGLGSFASAADTYKLVTDYSTLKDGDNVIVASHYVYESKGYDKWWAISTTQQSSNRKAVAVNVVNNEIELTDEIQPITLVSDNNGKFALCVSEGKYLGNDKPSSNGLKILETAQYVTLSEGDFAYDITGGDRTHLRFYTSYTNKDGITGATASCYGTTTGVNYSEPVLFKLVEEQAPVADEHYVLFDNTGAGWTPYVWAWNGSDNCTAAGSQGWPGDPMTLVEGNIYKWVLPEGKVLPSMILISNSGSYVERFEKNYVDCATYDKDGNATGGNQGNEEPVTGDVFAIAGAFNGWNTEANTATADATTGIATIVVENYTNAVDGQGEGFKVVYKNNNSWHGWAEVTNGGDYVSCWTGSDGGNIDLAAADGKTVTFYVKNGNGTNEMKVKVAWEAEQGDVEDPFSHEGTYYALATDVFDEEREEYHMLEDEEGPVMGIPDGNQVVYAVEAWETTNFYIIAMNEAFTDSYGYKVFGVEGGATLANGVAANLIDVDFLKYMVDGYTNDMMTLPESANGKEVSIVINTTNKTITATWEDPTTPTINTVAIAGAFNNWSTTANATTEIVDNCATIVVENYTNAVNGQSEGFKVVFNGTWLGTYETIVNGAWTEKALYDTYGDNIDLSAAEGKNVTFTFAIDTYTLKVEWTESTSEPELGYTYVIDFADQGWTENDTKLYTTDADHKVIWKVYTNIEKTEWVEFPTTATSNSSTYPAYYSNGLRVYEASKSNALAHHNVITINAPAETNFTSVKTTADCRIDGNDVAANTLYIFNPAKSAFEFSTPARPEGNSSAYNVAYTSMTVSLDKKASGVESIAAENAPVEYYNLQGVRVANPNAGIYIMRQGNKVSKVLVK